MKKHHIRILSDSEAAEIRMAPPGRGHLVRRHLRAMHVGKILSLHRLDWDWKNKTPYAIVKSENDKGGRQYEFYGKADYSGWYIKRVE